MKPTSEGYDPSSVASIIEYAQGLTGKCLADVVEIPTDEVNVQNRGNLGSLVERYFFEFLANNSDGPDFLEAGVELKVTGVKRNSHGDFQMKERLVLSMIDYSQIRNETWESSKFLRKCKNLLILFYLYDSNLPAQRLRFVLDPVLFQINESSDSRAIPTSDPRIIAIHPDDLAQIRRDWEFIREKVSENRAHELSEGDTFYLAACRKGSGGPKEVLRAQEDGGVPAKSRAFSFKQGFLNRLLANQFSQAASLGVGEMTTFESATKMKFSPYLGRTAEDISAELSFFKSGTNHKAFHRELALRILSGSSEKPRELVSAGIELKTVRLNGKKFPREHMSFPAFKYVDIVSEEWEESDFCQKLESKFLFVVFDINHLGQEILFKVGYWNMPYMDRMEAKKVWERTKSLVQNGLDKFPTARDNNVSHVRPHARNSEDTYLTPTGERWVKRCFWLNKQYVGSVIAAL